MSNVADVIARVTASMSRVAAEQARNEERAQTYAGPERRRSRIAASQQPKGETPQQVDPAKTEVRL